MPKSTRNSLVANAVLAVAALLAAAPMLVQGPSCGHDFDFHILSWLEAASQFAHLHYPRWAYTPAWNAGEPRFIFYPPLSWALGGLLGLVLPWTVVPAAFTWVALTLAGVIMRRLAARFCSPDWALVAAVLYLANPYMLFTAYERTAYGELLAAAWLPLLFAAALAEQVRMLPVAASLALVWLTNAPAAVMASYALAVVMLVRLCLPGAARMRMAASAVGGTVLGLALAAFYIVPAAYERRFVQIGMAVIPGMRPQEHFLFHRMGSQSFDDLFHDQVVRTASEVALLLLAGLLVALIVAWRGRRREVVVPLAVLTALIAFLLMPPSLFLWQHVPQLGFLQFPWRLTALLAVMLALAFAMALDRLRVALPSSLVPVAGLGLAAVLIFPAWHVFRQRCDLEDTVAYRVAQFHSNAGTEATDEYTPVGADGDALKQGDPGWWVLPEGADMNQGPPKGAAGGAPERLTVNAMRPEVLVLNRRAYPEWRVRVNGDVERVMRRADGLMAIDLPAGRDTVEVQAILTADELAGLGVSGLACLAAAAMWGRRRGRQQGP